MTIEQLCECSADELEKMSDEQLLQHFQKYLNVTRPEIARMERTTSVVSRPVEVLTEKKKNMLALLAAEGVDTGLMMRRRRIMK